MTTEMQVRLCEATIAQLQARKDDLIDELNEAIDELSASKRDAVRRLNERDEAREQVDAIRRMLGCKVGESLGTDDIVALLVAAKVTGDMVDAAAHLTAERNAALEEARKADARAEKAELSVGWDDAAMRYSVMRREMERLTAECEHLRARGGELAAALERADRATVDTVTEERRLLSEECERLRAALHDIRKMYVLNVATHPLVRDRIYAALAGASAPSSAPIRHVVLDLPGAPAEATVTREPEGKP